MRLIDADALKQQFEIWDEDDDVAVWSIMNEINSAPTIEPERKTGQWELAEDGWYCSNCRLYPLFDCDPEEKGIPFCPNCGADMRGEKNERI